MSPKFRSKHEGNLYRELKKKRFKVQFEPFSLDYRLPVYRGFCGDCNSALVFSRHAYIPDFVLYRQSVPVVIIEAKGKFESKDRKKMLWVRDCNPEYKYVMWFMRDNRMSKGSTVRYSDWARKNSFPFFVGPRLSKDESDQLRAMLKRSAATPA